MGQARLRGTQEQRRQQALGQGDVGGACGGVADRSAPGLILLDTLRDQVPGCRIHVDQFLKSADAFLVFVLDSESTGGSLVMSPAGHPVHLETHVLPRALHNLGGRKGPFVVAVGDHDLARRLEDTVRTWRRSHPAHGQDPGSLDGQIVVSLTCGLSPAVTSMFAAQDVEVLFAGLERTIGITPESRASPAEHSRLRAVAVDLVQDPVLQQSPLSDRSACTMALWCALNDPAQGAGRRGEIACVLEASAENTAGIGIFVDLFGGWTVSVSRQSPHPDPDPAVMMCS